MDSDKRTMRKRSGGKARKSDGGKARKSAPGTSGGQTPKRDRPADKPLTVMQFTQCMFGGLMQDRYTGVWADPAQKASYPNHDSCQHVPLELKWVRARSVTCVPHARLQEPLCGQVHREQLGHVLWRVPA